MRQAYDYWQDQPECNPILRAPGEGRAPTRGGGCWGPAQLTDQEVRGAVHVSGPCRGDKQLILSTGTTDPGYPFTLNRSRPDATLSLSRVEKRKGTRSGRGGRRPQACSTHPSSQPRPPRPFPSCQTPPGERRARPSRDEPGVSLYDAAGVAQAVRTHTHTHVPRRRPSVRGGQRARAFRPPSSAIAPNHLRTVSRGTPGGVPDGSGHSQVALALSKSWTRRREASQQPRAAGRAGARSHDSVHARRAVTG